MYVVYLTGGLASGKTTVADWLAAKGALIHDLDLIARQEQQSEEVKSALQQAFGEDILDEDRNVRRSLLAERAFATAEATQKLNDISWPPTIRRLEEYIHQANNQPSAPVTDQSDKESEYLDNLMVVQIPLLVEALQQAGNLLNLADEIITINADSQIRHSRAVQRGMDATDASQRLARQTSDEERQRIAHTVIDNSGSMDELHRTLESWLTDRRAKGMF